METITKQKTITWNDWDVTQDAADILTKMCAMAELGMPATAVIEFDDGTADFETFQSLVAVVSQLSGNVFIVGQRACAIQSPYFPDAGTYLFYLP